MAEASEDSPHRRSPWNNRGKGHPNHGTRLSQNTLGETAQIPGSVLSPEAANLGGSITVQFPDDGCRFLVVRTTGPREVKTSHLSLLFGLDHFDGDTALRETSLP